MSDTKTTQDKKWLIVFLIYADFTTFDDLPTVERTKASLNNMLGEILKTPLDGDTRMFVIFNRVNSSTFNSKDRIDDTTMLYTIERVPGENRNKISNPEPLDIRTSIFRKDGSDLLQKPDQLAQILLHTKKKNEEEVLFFTYDHGSSFGIFRDLPFVLATDINERLEIYPYLKMFWDLIPPGKIITKNTIAGPHHRVVQTSTGFFTIQKVGGGAQNFFDSNIPEMVTIDSKDGKYYLHEKDPQANFAKALENFTVEKASEILKNSELADAIKLWLKDQKVSVLVMANCWMMNLHTMYDLQHTVKFLVAPQGDIDCPCYNYADVLKYVTSKPSDMSPESIARCCVETSENEAARAKGLLLNDDTPFIIDVFKIFAVNLEAKYAGSEKKMLDVFIDEFEAMITVFNNKIECSAKSKNPLDAELCYVAKYIRSVCFDFSGNKTMMIDVVNWASSIDSADESFWQSVLVSNPVRAAIRTFKRLKFLNNNEFFIACTVGSKIYFIKDGSKLKAVIAFPPKGYSLFFPIFSITDPNLIDNILSDDLLKKMKNWKVFLEHLTPATTAVLGNLGQSNIPGQIDLQAQEC